ncbi:hypothetical protein VB713_00635 [Anabaena cylindrica UHCC 0172]|nr:hypothetical protein [Anabaena cylindrica]MEA5549498.1 hypothetical protein [Anabaena cylindrica UHCC 0172]
MLFFLIIDPTPIVANANKPNTEVGSGTEVCGPVDGSDAEPNI